MLKPNGYEKAQVQGEWEFPVVGGHHMVIKHVVESETKTGKSMVIIHFDFAKNDRQPELFANEYKADIRLEKKWPRRGTQYVVVEDNEGNTSRAYKTFCTCFEKSNNTKISWDSNSEKWCAQFKNKLIGGAFGIVHSVYDGKEYAASELRWFVTDSEVDPEKVPKERELSESDKQQLYNASHQQDQGTNDWMNVPDNEEALPFN